MSYVPAGLRRAAGELLVVAYNDERAGEGAERRLIQREARLNQAIEPTGATSADGIDDPPEPTGERSVPRSAIEILRRLGAAGTDDELAAKLRSGPSEARLLAAAEGAEGTKQQGN